MAKEWDNLRRKGVWDDFEVREWRGVVAEARTNKEKVHVGYLHGLIVLNSSELPESDPSRRYKYRVVFLGDRVRTQFFEQAAFNDQGSSPAIIEAARCCDAHGCLPGNDVEQDDAEQA